MDINGIKTRIERLMSQHRTLVRLAMAARSHAERNNYRKQSQEKRKRAQSLYNAYCKMFPAFQVPGLRQE